MDLERNSILLILALLQFFSGITGSLQTYGVQDLCDSTLTIKRPVWGLESSIILKPTRSGSFKENQNCSLVVKPLFGFDSYLVVSVRTIDLRPAGLNPSGADTLMITYRDGSYYKEDIYVNDHLSQERHHDPEESKSFKSSNQVTITFNTSAKSFFNTSDFEGFELIITAAELGFCDFSRFKCHSGVLCIADKLRCDGHNHCGDRSDQQNCGDTRDDTRDDTSDDGSNYDRMSSSNSNSSVVIGVCIVLFVLFLGLLIWFCRNNDCNGPSTSSSTYSRTRPGIYPIGSVNSYSRSSSSSDRYEGGSASRGYSAYESSYSGGDASGGYSAYESNYGGDSTAGCYSASESTYEGSSAAGCSEAY